MGSRGERAQRVAQAVALGALALVGLGGATASAAPATKGFPDYAYELVTPPSTAGQESILQGISPSGDQVLLLSSGGFADVDSLSSIGVTYRPRRTPTGWQTETLGNPPPNVMWGATGTNMDVERGWWLKDRPQTLWFGNLVGSEVPDGATAFAGSKGGPWHIVSPDALAELMGTSTDLSSVLVRTTDQLPLTDGTVDTRQLGSGVTSLVLSRRNPDGTLDLRQIGRQGGVSMFPTCSIGLGSSSSTITRGAVNREDFSRMIITLAGTGCTTGARARLWAVEPFSESPDAVEISSSVGCTVSCGVAAAVRFAGGALDTSRVYMTTTQKLLDADIQTGADIYEYDFRKPSGQRLSLVTGNSTPAAVQGVLDVSDDGSRIFFVANGDLDNAVHGDVAPVAGSRNLYLRMDDPDGGPPITRFIATLSTSDSIEWSIPALRQGAITPDGRYLVFVSAAHITPDKQPGDDFMDGYRYDVETGELVRLWPDDPAHNGANRTAGVEMVAGHYRTGAYANYEYQRDYLPTTAHDGSVIAFSTSEPLVAGDLNNKNDAFAWRAETGTVAMVSDGKDLRGTLAAGVSPDGSTIFFATTSQILPQHTSSSVGLYAYRRGGGFALPPAPAAPCRGDECQGQAQAPAAQQLGSVEFAGAGNVPGGPDRVRASVAVSKLKAVIGAAGKLRVRVPAPGRITVGGASVRGASTSASKAGSYSVRVALSARARKALRERKSLKVRVRVSYRARGGQQASKTVVVTFRRLSAKPSSVRKGGK